MPNVSFFGGYRDASRATSATIKALEERQKAANDALLASMKPQEVRHPLQGVADVLGTVGAGIREARAENQAQAGRDQLAKLMAGGLTPDEYGQAMGLDPELTQKYIGHDWEVQAAKDRVAAEKEAAAARAAVEQEAQTRLFGHEDTAATNLAKTQSDLEKQREAAASALSTQEAGQTAAAAAEKVKTDATAKVQAAALADPAAQVKTAVDAGYLTPEEGKTRIDAINAEAAKKAMSPGQVQTDTDMAKEANDWVGGGAAAATAQLSNIQNGIKILQSKNAYGGDLTGTGQGIVNAVVPEPFAKMLNPETYQARDSIRNAVQNSLKAVLGGQFARIEGENLLDRAFDINQPASENIRRAQLIQTQIATMIKAKQAMVDYYFKNNGSMQGFQYQQLDTSELERMLNEFANNPTTPPASDNGAQPPAAGGAQPPAGGDWKIRPK